MGPSPPIFVVLALALAAADARAQETNRFALGVNYTHRMANDEGAHGNGGIGIKWRVGHGKPGWGWQYGLGWFTTDIERTVGGRRVAFGELKVRPFVGGYGYRYPINDRLSVSADIFAGLAFNTFRLTDEADALLHLLDLNDVDVDISTAVPVLRPEVSLWYDINKRFGLSVTSGYSVARPTLTVTSAGSREKVRLRADTFGVSAGVVYRIF